MKSVLLTFMVLGCAAFAMGQQAAYAQSADQETATEIIIPENGPVNEEQARYIALRTVAGEVVNTIGYENNDDFYYEFTILRDDGTQMEVDVNADIAKVSDVKILFLGTGASLPPPRIKQEDAELKAVEKINKTTTGRKPKVRDTVYKIYEQRPAYDISLKKGSNDYRVVIDARTGRILYSGRE